MTKKITISIWIGAAIYIFSLLFFIKSFVENKGEMEDMESRVYDLELNNNLEEKVETLESNNDDLEEKVKALESKSDDLESRVGELESILKK